MKSCFGLLLVLVVFTSVVSTAGLLYYLSRTAEFTRTDKAAVQAPATPGAASAAPAPVVPPGPAPAVPR